MQRKYPTISISLTGRWGRIKMKTPKGTRRCWYSSPYGGRWVEGFFHRWTEVNERDVDGNTTRAIIEDAKTGAIYLIRLGNFQFKDET